MNANGLYFLQSKRLVSDGYISLVKRAQKKSQLLQAVGIFLVRLTGLEPAHRKTIDPKSIASTNFATGAEYELISQ
jgi:hypothetical protein